MNNYEISIVIPDINGKYRLDTCNVSIVESQKNNKLLQFEIDDRFSKILNNIRAFVWYMSGSYMGLFRLNNEDLDNAINLVASAIAELHKDYKTWTSENIIVVETRKELEKLIEFFHNVANEFPTQLHELKVMVKQENLPY